MGAPRFVMEDFWPSDLFLGGIPGAWYDPTDLSTMFQDSAGTTPVTAVEQPVGLIIDKKMPFTDVGYRSIVFDGTGDYLTLGGQSAFAWGSGDFTVEFWFYTAAGGTQTLIDTRPAGTSPNLNYYAIAYESGTVNYYTNNAPRAITGAAVPLNTWTHVAVCRSGTSTRLFVNGTQAGVTYTDTQTYIVGASRPAIGTDGNNTAALNFQGGMSNLRMVKGTALYTSNFTPSTAPLTAVAGTSLLTGQNATIVDNSSNAFAITVNGNTTTGWDSPFGANARQSTAASRPTYRARYNLLTYSEQFDDLAWTKSNCTLGINAGVAPDGTTTAEKLIMAAGVDPNGATGFGLRYLSAITSGTYTYSIYAKAVEFTTLRIRENDVSGAFMTVDLITGAITGSGAQFVSPTATALANGWWRVSWTSPSGMTDAGKYLFRVGSTGDGVSGILVWGAQLLTAADVTATGNAYQRIAAATVYDTAPIFRPYLAFDGLDDSLSTAAINFTATDKMTVWTGVTKSSSAGDIAGLSSDWFYTNGTFALGALPPSGYFFGLRGTVAEAYGGTVYAPPITNVLTVSYDIAGATIANEIAPRVNGTVPSLSVVVAGPAGTGNFGSHSLLLSRAAAPFNGRLYSLIVRGAASSTTEIIDTETWVNARTGGY